MWGRVSGQEHCPTLWVGTNAGTIYIHQLTVPSADKRSTDEVQCVLCMFQSLSTYLVAFLLCIGAQFQHCSVSLQCSFMAALCNRAGHIYFHPVVCCSSFFFPRPVSAVADWMSTILPHMVWP